MRWEEFLERVAHLRRDRSGGVPKPYKPLLLAAVVLLVHKRKIAAPSVLSSLTFLMTSNSGLRGAVPDFSSAASSMHDA